jgi:hypothetical protein
MIYGRGNAMKGRGLLGVGGVDFYFFFEDGILAIPFEKSILSGLGAGAALGALGGIASSFSEGTGADADKIQEKLCVLPPLKLKTIKGATLIPWDEIKNPTQIGWNLSFEYEGKRKVVRIDSPIDEAKALFNHKLKGKVKTTTPWYPGKPKD